jgi:hypothetical protein
MNLPADAARRLDAYLREVESHLAHQDPRVRRELLDELRAHVLEALQAQGGTNPTVADVERVLADMDTADCFAAPASAPSAPPAAHAARYLPLVPAGPRLPAGQRVRGLEMAARDRDPGAGRQPGLARRCEPARRGPPAAAARRPRTGQPVGLAQRDVAIGLHRGAGSRDALPRFLRLSEDGDPELSYELVGRAGSNVVLIQTETIARDTFQYRSRRGPAFARPRRRTSGGAGRARWRCTSQFQFQRLEAESPPFGACELRAIFNSRPDPNAPESFIAVDPPVSFTAAPLESWRGGGLRLVGDFVPGAVYTVTFKGRAGG